MLNHSCDKFEARTVVGRGEKSLLSYRRVCDTFRERKRKKIREKITSNQNRRKGTNAKKSTDAAPLM